MRAERSQDLVNTHNFTVMLIISPDIKKNETYRKTSGHMRFDEFAAEYFPATRFPFRTILTLAVVTAMTVSYRICRTVLSTRSFIIHIYFVFNVALYQCR